MINNMTTKTKILIPMFILTSILIFIGGSVVFLNYSQSASLKKLNRSIVLGSKVSAILHSLQKERGLSCGYVVRSQAKFKKDLLLQRVISDTELQKLHTFLNTISSKKLQDETRKLLTKISQLQNIRKDVDLYKIKYNDIITYYSQLNAMLLDIFVNISKDSHVPIITQNILAYSNFLYFKEYMGIERAEGVAIYSQQKVNRESLIRFSNIISLETRSQEMFLKYISPTMKAYYQDSIHQDSFFHVKSMREIIQYKENFQHYNIDANEWFETITASLNTLDLVAKFIEKEIVKNINSELDKLHKIFIIFTLLIIISIFVFMLMLVAFFKLAREEQRLRVVIDKYIISSTADLHGNIIDVSEAFCSISGYTKKELIGRSHRLIRHPDMKKEVFHEMWSNITQGFSWSGKVKNRKKDGSFYWVYANVEPLFTANGQIDSYISIRLDITKSELLLLKISEEEKKNKFQEKMMQEQSRLVQMGEMLSMIAHQWRQPLSAISAASGSLQIKATRDKLDNEMAIEIASKITGFSLHLSSTIDDFRNFFKPNKQETKTDFETILKSVLTIIEASLDQKCIRLTTKVIELSAFESYENELKQVLLNLIKNAEDILIDNKIEKPQIDIIINKKTLTIADNAGGIEEEIMDKIFDPYFSTKTKKDGTGLGLYMSKIIIEDHCHGKLIAINEKTGAKFQIILGEKND